MSVEKNVQGTGYLPFISVIVITKGSGANSSIFIHYNDTKCTLMGDEYKKRTEDRPIIQPANNITYIITLC